MIMLRSTSARYLLSQLFLLNMATFHKRSCIGSYKYFQHRFLSDISIFNLVQSTHWLYSR